MVRVSGSARRSSRRVVITVWFLVCTARIAAPGVLSEPRPTSPFDCGTNAVYLLLELEGHPATLDQIDQVLPPRHPDGYSMAELAAASGTLGLPLVGVRFGDGDPPLDRPAIAFFDDAETGHFAVLRPVGTTGTMVQVIDPPRVARIVDYGRLFSDTPWTGRVLVPRTPWLNRNAPLLLATAGLVLLAAVLGRRRRGSATASPG